MSELMSMNSKERESIVISLGGSLLVPDQIDEQFIRSFKNLIEDQVERGNSFFLITGGGKVCRRYQAALDELTSDSTGDDLDWMGIHTTRLNAHFVRLVFKDIAHPEIILDPRNAESVDAPVVIGAGWKPGRSTDYGTVEVARSTGADKIVNLSNISHVYDKDPSEYDDAQSFDALSWDEYLKIIPSEWNPGLNTPFDPIASRDARDYGLEVAIMNGSDLSRLQNYLIGEEFEGTIIS